MKPFWMLPMKVCVEAENPIEAANILKPAVATEIKELPYPADPRVGPQSDCPSFCWQPNACAGRSSCPRQYACSE